jgi:hypothetical protein
MKNIMTMGYLTRSQQRRKKQCQSVLTGVFFLVIVWYGLRLVYWDASPVFVKSHRDQLTEKSKDVDMDKMKMPAFRERIELFSSTLQDACTAHNLSTATHRNLELLGSPVKDSLAVTCEPFRSLTNLREVGGVSLEGYVICKESYGVLLREKRRIHPLRIGWWTSPWEKEHTYTTKTADETCTFGHLLDVLQAAWTI